jgi:Protein of unknown function (DUF3429)
MNANQATIEQWAYRLGLGGLLPFFALTLVVWFAPTALGGLAPEAQVLYAASILTFIGAVHWGLVLGASDGGPVAGTLIWSVLPSLYSWLVALLPPVQALPLMAVGLLIAWLVDRLTMVRYPFYAWFMRLRTVLTCGAVLSLALSWARVLGLGD